MIRGGDKKEMMKGNALAKSIVIGSGVIGVSFVLGCLIISRAPRFEADGGVLIETRTGARYEQSEGNPSYWYTPGPKSRGAEVKPVYQ